ncbi:MAG: hypothetical protein ACRDT8_10160 [Micromonosporaceae bacterium]
MAASPTRLNRSATAILGALLVLASVVGAPATKASAANAVFHVGHLNILSSISHDRFVSDLKLITSQAALVGLNEVGGRKAFLRDWANQNGWHFYAPEPNAASQDALLAKKSMFNVVNQGSVFACDTNGPDEVPPARYTNWVRYTHIASGRTVFHINAHANAHIDDNGSPYNLPRTECAEKQFRDIRDLAQAKEGTGQVIVSGDLNVDFTADKRVQYAHFPYTVLDERDNPDNLPGLRSCYSTHGVKGTGTLGGRHIDYIYFWKRVEAYRHMWMTDYQIVGGTESDHQGVRATFAIEL